MNSAAISASPAASPAPRLIVLRILLAIVAGLELFDSLIGAPMLLDGSSSFPGPGLGGAIIKLKMAVHPVLALAALILAAIGYVRQSIITIGAVVLMTWLSYMSAVARHGLDFSSTGLYQSPAQIFLYPLMAACAIALAARSNWFWPAAALAGIPSFLGVIGMVTFAIAVAIVGF
ncbi:MAG: hypothetical protein ACREEK_11065 [Bradyrhizobium sp.]